jgi:DNA-binding PadR family transcriptional regulator
MARRAKTRFLVLGMLSRGAMSGYEIAAEVREAISSFWRESFGSIYPTLAQLLHQGMIRRLPRVRAGRRRLSYRITPRGRAELRRWLSDPPEPDVIRNELLLKLYFGSEIGATILQGHLTAYRASQRSLLAYFGRVEEAVRAAPAEEARHKVYWLLCLDIGRRVTKARLAWVDRASTVLGRGRARRPARA